MTACFMVRAEVVDASIEDEFDHWYRDEHLPDALTALGARRAWRAWSETDPSVHYAFYEFDDVERARAILGSDALKQLAAEFNRAWGDQVKRSRDVVEVVQTIDA